VNGKDYPAYSFDNRSEDILTLFTWACGLARADVAKLDAALQEPAFRPWGWLAEGAEFLGRTASGKVS
jgi:hypothetical protein